MSEPTRAEIDADLVIDVRVYEPGGDHWAEYSGSTVRDAYLVGWRAGRESVAPRAWCASEHLRPGAAPRYNDSWVRCGQDAGHDDEHSDDVSGLTWTD